MACRNKSVSKIVCSMKPLSVVMLIPDCVKLGVGMSNLQSFTAEILLDEAVPVVFCHSSCNASTKTRS